MAALIALPPATAGSPGAVASQVAALPPEYLSPTALAGSPALPHVFVACATGSQVLMVDRETGRVVRSIALPAAPTGLALSHDGRELFVTCAAPQGTLCVIDTASGALRRTIGLGYHPIAPVPAPDGRTLYVCHQFEDAVAWVNLESGEITRRVSVAREPLAAALTRDGRHLLVANHLHAGRADVADAAAVVSVIDVAAGVVTRSLRLPTGSGVLRDIRMSPDGRYAAVTHLLARYHLPTTQVERGWINGNALTLIDANSLEISDTVLLDAPERGAANPWGLAWSADGGILAVAHAGTHEVSLIETAGLLRKLALKPREGTDASGHLTVPPIEDLSFLSGLSRRVPLDGEDLSPRGLLILGDMLWTANAHSDTLTRLRLATPEKSRASLALGPRVPVTPERQGEITFHDARICVQGWQSCASCHPGDARVDGLNWDLLNDGLGNPKNNRSLLYTHRFAPAMSMGVRDSAEAAVRAGIRHILFTTQPEPVPAAIDAYLRALRPVPSPRLVDGKLSAAAQRGERLFHDARVGCVECHPGPYWTDLKRHDVGTLGELDRAGDAFFTPTLIEVWRTAPYLHDGSSATMREVLTTRNARDTHGRTSHLSAREIDDLVEFILSL
jgi:DNA-binding beta-propeller fold protein YncE